MNTTESSSSSSPTSKLDSPDSSNSSSPSLNRGFFAILLRIVPPVLIMAVGIFGYLQLSVEPEETKKGKSKPRPIKTQVVELVSQNYPTRITSQGNVRPHDQITLNSEVAGRIVRISPNFEDGAFFSEGDVLAELDTADFEATLANAEAQVARTTSSYALEKAQSDQARQNWIRLSSNEDEQPDPLVLRIPQLKQAEANVKSANAQLDRAQRDLERTRIRAPFDGRVRQRSVGLGQAIRINSTLGTIFASDYAEVRLPISTEDLPLLALPENLGDPPVGVELSDSLNPGNGALWKAEIVRTEGALDASSLELFAIAKVDDPFGLHSGKPPLRIGQPVTASISGKILENVMPLPRLGVKRLDQVYLVDPDKMTLHKRTIVAIWADEDHVIIRDPDIPDGILMSTTKLGYAPEGGQVEILPDINPDALKKSAWLEAMGVSNKPKEKQN
ncbi:MAG TPA: efflux RND transporter periplasmic adaptor subunit [Opitutae bacterium]|nr:efflux RND transporter periplasmic adaptor subunit [Opitutae bacterium]